MELNKFIDHTLLKPDATKNDIDQLCKEAKQYHFASVCVNPYYVAYCAKLLGETDVKVCTVIGFPLGQMTVAAKCAEANDVIAKGAQEVDMVLNIAALKDKNLSYVTEEIRQVKDVCRLHNVILKVIIETCMLDEQNKIDACQCVTTAGADYIKTSTGFSTGGATIEDVALLKKHIGPNVKVKASGGIKNKEDAVKMIEAGASRLGTSRGVELIK